MKKTIIKLLRGESIIFTEKIIPGSEKSRMFDQHPDPPIFHTLVTGGYYEGFYRTYHSSKAARKGHEEMVQSVKVMEKKLRKSKFWRTLYHDRIPDKKINNEKDNSNFTRVVGRWIKRKANRMLGKVLTPFVIVLTLSGCYSKPIFNAEKKPFVVMSIQKHSAKNNFCYYYAQTGDFFVYSYAIFPCNLYNIGDTVIIHPKNK